MEEHIAADRPLAGIFRRVRNFLVKGRYGPHTRAEYLRKRGARIGEGCFIGPPDIEREIDPRGLTIGNHVAIASGVSFMRHDKARDKAFVEIGDNCFIGFRAVLSPNIRIGPNSVVAAGSLVTSDVPPDTLVMGAPARPFGSLARYRQKCLERWQQQRPPGVVIEPHQTWWNTRHLAANRELLKKHLLMLFGKQLG